MNARERWYALHRARRVAMRDENKRIHRLVRAAFNTDERDASTQYLRRAYAMAIHPPIVIDPVLNDIARRLV